MNCFFLVSLMVHRRQDLLRDTESWDAPTFRVDSLYSGKMSLYPWNSVYIDLLCYVSGYKKIKSVMRTCGTPETFGCGINCCQGSIYDDTCQYQCQGELCNGENEAKRIQTGSPGKPPGGSGTNLNITFTSICVFLLLYLFSVKFVIMRNILWTWISCFNIANLHLFIAILRYSMQLLK